MTITVFGASGKVGRLVVAEALRRGISVRAFVHRANPFEPAANLTIIQGDIYSSKDVERALDGADAVVSCLGSWGTPKRNVLTTAMSAIIPAMHAHKIIRIVTLTGSGAIAPDKKPGLLHRLFMKSIAWTPAGKVFADGEQHMRLLLASDLEWTTIRSPVMKNGKRAAYRLVRDGSSAVPRINRAAVVAAMLDQLQGDDWLRQAPVAKAGK